MVKVCCHGAFTSRGAGFDDINCTNSNLVVLNIFTTKAVLGVCPSLPDF